MSKPATSYDRYYRKWHDDSDEHVQAMRQYYAHLFSDRIPEDPGLRILDVGCGMGFALDALRAMGYRNLKGIDVDEGQVDSSLAKGLQAQLVDDSVAYLHANTGQFDLIFALDVIEHVPVSEQPAFCTALWAALGDGGMLLVTVPNANSAIASRWRYNDYTHCTSFTEHSLDFLLYGANFTDIQIHSYDRQRHWPKPDRWISGWPISRWFWTSVGEILAFRLSRAFRRLQMWGELGREGLQVPLSLNLLGIARKQ